MARSKKVNAVPVLSSKFAADNKQSIKDARKGAASRAKLAEALHKAGVRAEMLYSPKGKPERAAFIPLYNSFVNMVRSGFTVAEQKLMAMPAKGMTDAKKVEKDVLLQEVGSLQKDIRNSLKAREAADAPKGKQKRQPHQKNKIAAAPTAPVTKHDAKGEKKVIGIADWVHHVAGQIAEAVETYSGTEITPEQREHLVKLAKQMGGYLK